MAAALPNEADELREAIARIRRDLDAGHCTPERLAANLGRCDELLDMLFGPEGQDVEFELTLPGLEYVHASQREASARRCAFEVIPGGRE